MTRNFWVEIISCTFIFLFVYAAITKLMDYQRFVVQIGQSPMLTTYAHILAWLVPIVEMLIAALLVFSSTRLVGLYAAFGLMTMFTVYIILASRFSAYVPCSCGGVIQDLTWTQHLFFNTFFIVAGVAAVLMTPVQAKHSSSQRAISKI